MNTLPAQLTLSQWQERYAQLKATGLQEPAYGGPLLRHADQGDKRLGCLKFDNSPAALHLWNFLLTEEDRLRQHRTDGKRIIGTMKDLGTVPILVNSFDDMVAFYPDGAWLVLLLGNPWCRQTCCTTRAWRSTGTAICCRTAG
jgi:hypothetical protein